MDVESNFWEIFFSSNGINIIHHFDMDDINIIHIMAYGQKSDVWACPNMVGIPPHLWHNSTRENDVPDHQIRGYRIFRQTHMPFGNQRLV